MIEFILIILQFFVLSLLFLFPITPHINNSYLGKYNFDIYNILTLNIILNLNIYLIISIFITDVKSLFFINIGLALFFIFINLKKNTLYFKSIDWRLLFLFFIINISFYTSLAEDPKLNWDGVVQWLPKASTYFQGLGYTNVGAYSYPHLGGFLWGYFWKNSYLEIEYLGRLFYVFFYILGIFSLINHLQIKKKSKFAILVIFLFFIISLTYDKFLFGGYQDTLLFTLLIIISKFLYLIIVKNRKSSFIYFLYFITAFICCWIKQEGFIYFITLTFILIFFEKQIKKKIILSISTVILLAIFLFIKNYLVGEIQFDQKLNIYILNQIDFDFMSKILLSLLQNMIVAVIKYPLWLLILFFILFSIISKKNISIMKYVYLYFILNLMFIFFIIFYSCLNLGFDSCSLIMKVSMDRILYQSSGFYLIWIIYLFNNSKLLSNQNFN